MERMRPSFARVALMVFVVALCCVPAQSGVQAQAPVENDDARRQTSGPLLGPPPCSGYGNGKFSGTVVDADTNLPIPDVFVHVESDVPLCVIGRTDAQGNYTVGGLATGNYKVSFVERTYITQWFDNKPSATLADPVNVISGTTTTNINARLKRGGVIQGTVTDDRLGLPADRLPVALYGNSGSDPLFTGFTDRGYFEFAGLPSGQYRLRFGDVNSSDWAVEFYADKPDLASANLINVTAPNTTTITASVTSTSAAITGVVTAEGSSIPVSNTTVFAIEDNVYPITAPYAVTNDHGHYAIKVKPGVAYRVLFKPASLYANEYFDQSASWLHAKRITVGASQVVSNVNASLQVSGTITGQVTTAAGGMPLSGTIVYLRDALIDADVVQPVTVDASGVFTFTQLYPTSYKLLAAPADLLIHMPRFYSNAGSFAAADAVTVSPGMTTTANIALPAWGASPQRTYLPLVPRDAGVPYAP